MEKLYADIIINISHEALDKVFAYKVPFSMIKDIRVGQQVVVPFGRSNKEQTGYVVNLSRTVDYDESKVKEILRIETDHVGVESNMIELAAWIRENYGSTMIQALKTVLTLSYALRKCMDQRCLMNISVSIMWRKQDFLQLY